jgi:reverse gyrase
MFRLTKKEYPGVETCLGGAISSKSKEFVKNLVEEELLNKFETRYIIFDAKKVDLDNFEQLIFNATKFELQWLKYIHKRYADYAAKDHQRILMIQDRFEKSLSK